MKRYLSFFILIFLVQAPLQSEVPDDVIIVLSKSLTPYQEALRGLQKVLQREFRVFNLEKEDPVLSRKTQVVVALGGKAATYKYPRSVDLVYCLAPGTLVTPEQHQGGRVKVSMVARPDLLISHVREIQPSIQSLTIFWLSPHFKTYIAELQAVALARQLTIEAIEIKNPANFAKEIRRLSPTPEAIFFLPDPPLLTVSNLSIIQGYSRFRKTPVYVPLEGLLQVGGTVSIACSFEEMGRVTGMVTRHLLNSQKFSGAVYPEQIQVTVNAKTAQFIGLNTSKSASKIREK